MTNATVMPAVAESQDPWATVYATRFARIRYVIRQSECGSGSGSLRADSLAAKIAATTRMLPRCVNRWALCASGWGGAHTRRSAGCRWQIRHLECHGPLAPQAGGFNRSRVFVIQVQNLVVRYGEKEALRGISFTARAGEITGYLGPNGAGKSTTMKVLAGLLRPTSGQVFVGGHDISHDPLSSKRILGYVPESADLYQSLTPNEYFSLLAELYELERAAASSRIRELLHAFELTPSADKQIQALSKGMRQKVLLIGAVLHDPQVMLFDEPLNGLDVQGAHTLRTMMEQMVAQRKTVLYCSHILDVVERVCSRVIVLSAGQIVADDSTHRLLAGSPRGTLEAVFQQLTRTTTVDKHADTVRLSTIAPNRDHEP